VHERCAEDLRISYVRLTTFEFISETRNSGTPFAVPFEARRLSTAHIRVIRIPPRTVYVPPRADAKALRALGSAIAGDSSRRKDRRGGHRERRQSISGQADSISPPNSTSIAGSCRSSNGEYRRARGDRTQLDEVGHNTEMLNWARFGARPEQGEADDYIRPGTTGGA